MTANKDFPGNLSGRISRNIAESPESRVPESGPPAPEELGLAAPAGSDQPRIVAIKRGRGRPPKPKINAEPPAAPKKRGRPPKLKPEAAAENAETEPPPNSKKRGLPPKLAAYIGGLEPQLAAVWPAGRLAVEWVWCDDPEPVAGDVLGWNWQRTEIALVIGHPPAFSRPWTVTIAVRPMPKEWQQYKAFNLHTGEDVRLTWYTRWNRRYVLEDDPEGQQPRSGWLAVVQDEKAAG